MPYEILVIFQNILSFDTNGRSDRSVLLYGSKIVILMILWYAVLHMNCTVYGLDIIVNIDI